jgi:hypothetical protein
MNKHVNGYSKINWKFSYVSFCFNVRISLDFISFFYIKKYWFLSIIPLTIGICQGHPLSGLLFALGPFRAYWCAMMVPFVI